MSVKRKTRRGLISWQQQQLTLSHFQMLVILLLTGFVGFLSSFLLLQVGLSKMWLRYPLAILSAYIAFLLLLRLWLAIQRYQNSSDFDLPINAGSSGTSSPSADFSFGGGGEFSGGGAGGSWGIMFLLHLRPFQTAAVLFWTGLVLILIWKNLDLLYLPLSH